MKYNQIRSSITEPNLTEGNVDLNINYILSAADNDGTPVTTLSGGSILCLDTDLGSRLSLSELNYYFDSSVDKATTVNDINFYYKNESFDTYVSLETTYTGIGNLYNATISGTPFAPRYIRMKHTVNASGTLYGYEILNNDDVVDFGTDGTLTSETVAVSRNYGVDIKEIPIYNDGPGVVDAIVLVEPQDTDVDYILSVANDDEGPWYGPHTHEIVAATDGTWSDGKFLDTTTLNNEELLIIAGDNVDGVLAYPLSPEYGRYQTKIFQNDSSRLNHINVIVYNRDDGMRVVNNIEDSADTVMVKSASTKPVAYSTYMQLVYVSNYIRSRTYWQMDETLIEESGNLSTQISYTQLEKYKIYTDPWTGNYCGMYYLDSTNSSTSNYFTTFNCINGEAFTVDHTATSSNTAPMVYSMLNIKMNSFNGQWIYIYVREAEAGVANIDGYYLIYYDSSMDDKFSYYRTVDFLEDLDVVYGEDSVWIADSDGIQMKKFAGNGDVLTLYNSVGKTDDLGSISIDNRDNSVWFSNGVDLHRINEYGNYIESIEGVGASKIQNIELALDNNDEMWIHENESIKRIMLTDEPGRVLYEVTVTSAVNITPTINGVWVSRYDGYMSYVSSNSRSILTTITTDGLSDYYGVVDFSYDDDRYTDLAPLSIDSGWTNASWNEVVLHDYTLPEDHYQQLQITLNKSLPYENYNVPIGEEWQVDESFAQVSGTLPNDQRWSDWNSGIEFVGNALRLFKGGIVDSYINSQNRFYVKDDFDIQFSYSVVNGVPSSDYVIFGLLAESIDVPGAYIKTYFRLQPTGTNYSRFYLDVNGSQVNSYFSSSSTYGYGDIRLTHNTTTNEAKAYIKPSSTGDWLRTQTRTTTEAAVGRRFYIKFYIYNLSIDDVDISNLDVSSLTNHNNIYNYCLAPQVSSIFTQKAVEVYDIHPQTSKNVYLKTEIPSDLDLGSTYDSDLRVRWRIPVE